MQSSSWRALIALCVSILFGIAGQLLMKWAALRTVGVGFDWSLVLPCVVAILIYSAGIVNWFFAVRHLPLSIAYPLTGLNYIGILAGSYYWFGERLSMTRIAGVALIFLGVLLVAAHRRVANRSLAAPRPDGARP